MGIIVKLLIEDIENELHVKIWNDLAKPDTVTDCISSNPIVSFRVPFNARGKNCNLPAYAKTHPTSSDNNARSEKLKTKVTNKFSQISKRKRNECFLIPGVIDVDAFDTENRNTDPANDKQQSSIVNNKAIDGGKKRLPKPSPASNTEKLSVTSDADTSAGKKSSSIFSHASNTEQFSVTSETNNLKVPTDGVNDKQQSSVISNAAVSTKKNFSKISSHAGDTELPSTSKTNNLEAVNAKNKSLQVENTQQCPLSSKTNNLEIPDVENKSPDPENTKKRLIFSGTKNLKANIAKNETVQINRTEDVQQHNVIPATNNLETLTENDALQINCTKDYEQRSEFRGTKNLEVIDIENEIPLVCNIAKEKEQHSKVPEPNGSNENSIQNDPTSALSNTKENTNRIFLSDDYITEFLKYLDQKFHQRKSRGRQKSSPYSLQRTKSSRRRGRNSFSEEMNSSQQTDSSTTHFISIKNKTDTCVTPHSESYYQNKRTSPCAQGTNRNLNISGKCGFCKKSEHLDIICNKKLCAKTYHLKCLKGHFSCAKENRWLCPRHFCCVCKTMTRLRECVICLDSYCENHIKGNVLKDVKSRYWCKKHVYITKQLQMPEEYLDEMDVQSAVEVETQSESEDFSLTINFDSDNECSEIDTAQKKEKETTDENPNLIISDVVCI